MNRLLSATGSALARYLSAPSHCAPVRPPSNLQQLKAGIRPGDVLLVEGRSRFSSAIKYLTHSVWSHAALYVGPLEGSVPQDEDSPCFVEADVMEGVRAVGFAEFAGYNVRLCRPIALRTDDIPHVVAEARGRIGHRYDLRNIIDLLRYLLPTPPVPGRWRRRMLALGSGDPTRAICSSLIAHSFQAVHYPILPRIEASRFDDANCTACQREQWHIRHSSLFVPADFDLSPYFAIVKPEADAALDYRALPWASVQGTEHAMARQDGVSARLDIRG
ncbi:MAG: lipo-like protein [Betaproteobacteria bacterium]|nr:lipo-like protein [Betaproteobacteria bacterium]